MVSKAFLKYHLKSALWGMLGVSVVGFASTQHYLDHHPELNLIKD